MSHYGPVKKLDQAISVSGYIQWSVINPDGSVEAEGEHPNLILDSGLDQVAQYVFADLFKYCAVGTGSTAPDVSQQGLITEAARTNNYLTGVGNCGTTKSASNVWVLKRTFDFPIGALNGNYSEVGFSPLGTAGPNLFSRTLIQNAGQNVVVSINSSQQLRVIYQLTVTLGPTAETTTTPNVNGWPIAPATTTQGKGKLQNLTNTAIRNVLTSGATDSSGGELDPGSTAIPTFISSSDLPLAAVGNSVDRATGFNSTNKNATAVTYTGTKSKNFKLSLSTSEGNHVVRSMGIGNATSHFYAFLFDQNQTKSDLYTLDILFTMSWGRN